jgi:hypothetical protein
MNEKTDEYGSLFVKLEDAHVMLIAVGEYRSGTWQHIDYNPKRPRGAGSRACGRGDIKAVSNNEVVHCFNSFTPHLREFEAVAEELEYSKLVKDELARAARA